MLKFYNDHFEIILNGLNGLCNLLIKRNILTINVRCSNNTKVSININAFSLSYLYETSFVHLKKCGLLKTLKAISFHFINVTKLHYFFV